MLELQKLMAVGYPLWVVVERLGKPNTGVGTGASVQSEVTFMLVYRLLLLSCSVNGAVVTGCAG